MTGIERLTAAEFGERLPVLREQGLPAVVTGLFAGSVLASVDSADRLRELLGDEPVSVGVNYIDMHVERVRRFIRGAPMPRGLARTPSTVGAFLDLPDPGRHIVTEQPTPAVLRDGIDLGPLGVRDIVSGDIDPYTDSPPDTAYSLMFMAGPGNSSDLHTDGDGRDVLLHQAFGRKRVCLLPSSAAPLLHPVGPFSTVRLAAMQPWERKAFLDYAGGVEHVLMPGETVFMPAFIWHHFDYLDVSMSVAFRFGGVEDPLARELIRTVHLDQYVQRVIVGTRDPSRAEPSRAAARRVLDAAARRYGSARAKYRAVRAAAASVPDDAGWRRPDAHIEVEDFLEGGLAGFYSRSPAGPAGYHRWWHLRERVRDQLRRRARHVAHWA